MYIIYLLYISWLKVAITGNRLLVKKIPFIMNLYEKSNNLHINAICHFRFLSYIHIINNNRACCLCRYNKTITPPTTRHRFYDYPLLNTKLAFAYNLSKKEAFTRNHLLFIRSWWHDVISSFGLDRYLPCHKALLFVNKFNCQQFAIAVPDSFYFNLLPSKNFSIISITSWVSIWSFIIITTAEVISTDFLPIMSEHVSINHPQVKLQPRLFLPYENQFQ